MNILHPLASYKNYTVKHILTAFQYSEDAYSAVLTPDIGKSGTHIISKCGKGVVLVNEFTDLTVSVAYCETTWSFFSPLSVKSSSYVGTMSIDDVSGFMFADILKDFADELNTSMHHLTIAWVPIFIGDGNAKIEDLISPNPMHFHITKFIQDVTGVVGRKYIFEFIASYNTHGLLPQYSRLYQSTITNRSSNLTNTLPAPVNSSSGIQATRKEDSFKLNARKLRLDKVKLMSTIGDVMQGLEEVLDSQKLPNKKQVQVISSIFRDEYVKKIKEDKQQDIIPIDYTVDIEEYYAKMEINNRNLPFEQYELDQSLVGISTMTIPMGSTPASAINTIMKMSRSVAQDHSKTPAITYRTTTSTNRDCSGNYKINIKVRQAVAPHNSGDNSETGPGDSLVDKEVGVIDYVYDNVDARDNNVTTVSFASFPNIKLTSLEDVEDQPDAKDVYGNREPITSSRFSSLTKFFREGFSGFNSILNVSRNNGLEDSNAGSTLSGFNETQQTTYVLTITGNPHLLNDINRNPYDVIHDEKSKEARSERGHYIIYKNVETDPMYIKLKLFNTSHSDTREYFYDGYLHLYKIQSIFIPGAFMQHLYCGRTEEIL